MTRPQRKNSCPAQNARLATGGSSRYAAHLPNALDAACGALRQVKVHKHVLQAATQPRSHAARQAAAALDTPVSAGQPNSTGADCTQSLMRRPAQRMQFWRDCPGPHIVVTCCRHWHRVLLQPLLVIKRRPVCTGRQASAHGEIDAVQLLRAPHGCQPQPHTPARKYPLQVTTAPHPHRLESHQPHLRLRPPGAPPP